MKTWHIGVNNLYKKASISLEICPFYIFWIQDLIMLICSKMLDKPIPFGSLINVERDGKKYSINEYYGNIGDIFHIFVCDKIVQWTFTKIEWEHVDIDYDRALELIEFQKKHGEY